jgi:small-conductance mechanosensitive channel
MNKLNIDVTKAYDLLADKLEGWLAAAIKMLPNLVVAILVLLVFVFMARLVKNLLSKLFRRFTDNHSLQNLLGSIIYIGIIAIGTFIALSILKLDGAVTSLLAGAGVIGLALGFAFQDIASNFIAGTMMGIRKPFNVGDLIETNDFFGKVLRIDLRTTLMETMEGQRVLIPNAEVFKKPIVNYTSKGQRRIDLEVGVTYGTDLEFAKRIAKEAVEGLERVDKDNVTIFYKEFGSSSINFTIRYWIDFGNTQFEWLDRRDAGVIAIKKAFDENDITIPFPIRTLDFGDTDFKGIFGQAKESLGASDTGAKE